ncbi:MAG: TMEM165/GDT1 family protein [Ilumatobacteraceae bacterium]
MIDLLSALVVAFGVVFVAELGDKTQLLALGYGAKYSLKVVALGLTVGYAIANVLATVVGGVLGAALPDRPIQIVSGLVFLVFAALAVRDALDEPEPAGLDADGVVDPDVTAGPPDTGAQRSAALAVIGSIALTIAIAEMGDKTQITTATLASQSSPVGVWIGATLGAASSGMLGAIAGRTIGHRISTRWINIASAVLFAAFGVAMLAGWF